MSNLLQAEVTDVHHWTDRLFTFKTTRDPAFRFASGQFTMIGLEVNGKPLLRAYSIASAAYEDMLEFLSIKVPDGPLTSRLQHLKTGDKILVGSTTILKFTYHDNLDEIFQKQMYESALRDGLTKAFNKKYFTDRLESEFTFSIRVPRSSVSRRDATQRSCR